MLPRCIHTVCTLWTWHPRDYIPGHKCYKGKIISVVRNSHRDSFWYHLSSWIERPIRWYHSSVANPSCMWSTRHEYNDIFTNSFRLVIYVDNKLYSGTFFVLPSSIFCTRSDVFLLENLVSMSDVRLPVCDRVISYMESIVIHQFKLICLPAMLFQSIDSCTHKHTRTASDKLPLCAFIMIEPLTFTYVVTNANW